jgi:hypothetical protein
VTTTSSVSKSIIGALSRISTASAQATGGSSARRFSAGCASDAGAGDGAIGRRAGAGLAVGLGRGATVAGDERVGAGVAVGETRRVSVAFTAAVGFGSAPVTVGIGGGGGAGGATVGVGRRGSGVLAPTVRNGRTASIRTLPGGGAEPK